MGLIDYARVSTTEDRQVLDRQIDALNQAGCERIFDDRASGAKAERPGLAACLDHLRKGDVLVVLDLDRLGRLGRLGRLASELIALIDHLAEREIAFRAINSPMDTTTPAGRAFLQIQAAFAEMERNVIRQRVKEGLKAARARGRKGGRPRIMTADKLRYAQHLMSDRERTIPSICQNSATSRPQPSTITSMPMERSRNRGESCSRPDRPCRVAYLYAETPVLAKRGR